MLKIEHLVKNYGAKKAVDDISFEVKEGEIFGFIGHNGAGKTTALKSIVGLLSFEGGEIFVDGYSVKKSPLEVKKRIAYIPDNPDIYDYMTGMQYLNFISDIFGVATDVRAEKISLYSKVLEIADDLNAPIASYSHGMKQKLSVISALVHEPKLLIMDEPFVGLDPKASHTLKNIMHGFCDNGGAILFSTHVLEVAEKLCDKVAIIKAGKLVKCGTMEEVKGDSSLEDAFLNVEK